MPPALVTWPTWRKEGGGVGGSMGEWEGKAMGEGWRVDKKWRVVGVRVWEGRKGEDGRKRQDRGRMIFRCLGRK